MKEGSVLIVGSVNMDLVLSCSHVPNAGETILGDKYVTVPGGKGANQAIAVAKSRGNGYFLGCIGNDTNGLKLKNELKDANLNLDYLQVSQSNNTGLAVIMLDNSGQNRIIVYSGANMDITKDNIDKAFEKHFDCVLLQFEVAEEIVVYTCNLALEKNIPVIVDAGPSMDFPLERIKGITVISPNETETYTLTGILPSTDELACEAAKILVNRCSAKYVVIKRGAQGAYVFGQGISQVVPTPKVKVVDTTAAGDAFTGAFTTNFIKTGDVLQATQFGVIAGALAVSKFGAQPSIPTYEEIVSFANTNEY